MIKEGQAQNPGVGTRNVELSNRMVEILGSMKAAHAARELGWNSSTFDLYLKGGMPSGDRLFAIADYFQVEARWLATGQGPKELRSNMVEYNDVEWVKLREFDARRLGDDKQLKEIGSAFVRRDEVARFSLDNAKLWVTRMPSNALPELAREGETIICTAPEEQLVDGAAYLLRVGRAVLVRRFSFSNPDWNPDGSATWSQEVPGGQAIKEVELATLGRILATISYRSV